jgi:prepilin-type N-terminal cleavage/methylation domain-containing protein
VSHLLVFLDADKESWFVRTNQMMTLLRYFARNRSHGFTLMEVMVVIVIGGVLAAIALPAFLGRVNSAKQAEAKAFLGTMNRAQQAYVLERSSFSDTVDALGISLPGNGNYRYSIQVGTTENPHAVHSAESLFVKLRPYVGMAAMIPAGGELGVHTIICEAEKPALGKAPPPTLVQSDISCAPGTQPLE